MAVLELVAPNHADPEHLILVKQRMEQLGPPTIRVIKNNGRYYALEGSHRIAAAVSLGYPINFNYVSASDRITAADGWEDLEGMPVADISAGEVVRIAASPVTYTLETIETPVEQSNTGRSVVVVFGVLALLVVALYVLH